MLTRDYLVFDLARESGILTAALRGEIDHHTAANLRTEIDGVVKKYSRNANGGRGNSRYRADGRLGL